MVEFQGNNIPGLPGQSKFIKLDRRKNVCHRPSTTLKYTVTVGQYATMSSPDFSGFFYAQF